MKIRTEIILIFILLVLLIVIMGSFSIFETKSLMEKEISASALLLNRERIDKIDLNIQKRIEGLKNYAQTKYVKDELKNSNIEFEGMSDVSSFIEKKDFEWLLLPKEEISQFMQSLIENNLSEDLRERLKYDGGAYDYKVFEEIFLTNRYGVNIAQSAKTSDYNQADELWWQLAKETGTYVGDVEYDESANVYSISMGVRIDDEEGKFLGVMKAVLNLEEIIIMLRDIENEENISDDSKTIVLVNRDKKVIYSSEEYVVFENLTTHYNFTLAETSGYNLSKKEKKLFIYAYSKGYMEYSGTGWILLTSYDNDKIFAKVYRILNVSIMMTIIAVLIAIVAGWVFAKDLLHPIYSLKESAVKLANGNLKEKVKIINRDEIDDLSKTFNDMAKMLQISKDKLESYNSNLEKNIAKRTAELKKKNAELEHFNKIVVDRELKMIELKKKISNIRKRGENT